MLFFETLRRQPNWLVLIEALVLVALIGWVDYATGWEWNFFAPFALPIILVTWKTGRRLGFACAALCALTFWVAHREGNPYQTGGGFGLSVVGRLFYFSVLVVAVAALKSRREIDRAHIAGLERTHELEQQILLASEREQQRIGQDLHDNLGPHLAAIGYAAAFLEKELRQCQQLEAAAKSEQIRKMAGDAVSIARDMARGIFLMPMDGSGLPFALEELARTTSSLTGISVSFHETGDIQNVDSQAGMHLYRIAQEAANNAVKHSGGRKVTIALNQNKTSLRLTIADDGKGVALAANGKHGMGMQTMSCRARSLGGNLKIDSKPGEGMIVSCEIPYPPPLATSGV